MSFTLLIRADAGLEIGTGHVMRCLALAEPWLQSDARVILASAKILPTLEQRAKAAGIELQSIKAMSGSSADAKQLTKIAKGQNADWIVVDGYHFGGDYQRALKKSDLRVLFFDDFGHAKNYCADFVLNQNLGADQSLYRKRSPETQLLLGTRFVQLRNEFVQWRDWQRTISHRAKKILVTLGGSDAENVTGKVIQTLEQLPNFNATVILGGGNPYAKDLAAGIRNRKSKIHFIQNANNMPELMAEADLAIAAGGTTAWELAFMGLPALTIVMADNQRLNAKRLESFGVAHNFGWHKKLSPKKIATKIKWLAAKSSACKRMSKRGRKLVDGFGAFRVWLYLNETQVCFRQATEDDARLIWKWANESGVRAASFSSEKIPWKNHQAWFKAKLADSNCLLWIADDKNGNPVGMIRFDLKGKSATISVSLDKLRRGKNLGALLIWSACRKLFRETSAKIIHAFIKPDNQASIRAFERAGFEQMKRTVVNGRPALQFQLRRVVA